MALRGDDTVWAWGLNDYGQIGDGTITNRLIPVQSLIELTEISAVPSRPGFGIHRLGYAQRPEQTITVTNNSDANVTLAPLPNVPNWTLVQSVNWTTAMSPGATRTFTIRPDNGLPAGIYNPTITITGSGGVSTTIQPRFEVYVPSAPVIISHPSNQAVPPGGTAIFTVVATGRPTPTFQWQVSTNNGGTWSNLSGQTSSILTLPNVTAAFNGRRYRVVITNSLGSVTSNAAVLAVATPINISNREVLWANRSYDWAIGNLIGVDGRRIRVEFTNPVNAVGSVNVYRRGQRINSTRIDGGRLEFETRSGETYEVRFIISTGILPAIQYFDYTIRSL